MKKIILSIAYLLLLMATIHAQPNQAKRSSLGFSVGWQQLKFLDQHASPLIYKAKAFPDVGMYYNHKTNNSIFEMKISGGKGSANPLTFGPRNYKTRFTDTSSFEYQIASQFIHANIDIGYLRKLPALSSGKMAYWAGGTISESAYYADEVANFPWLMNTVDISPAFQMDYNINSTHNLGIKVDFTCIGLVTRSVYGLFAKSSKDKNVESFVKQGTRLVTPAKYQKAHLELNYRYYASRRFALGAEYNLTWFHYTYPKPLRAVSNQFNLNIEYLIHQKS